MNNRELINQYRQQLLLVHGATVTIVSIAEIIAYFVFVYMGVEALSFECPYLWHGVVVPIVINAFAHLTARFICATDKVSTTFKNHTVIYAAIVTSFVVSAFHRDYIIASCAYVFPIILCALYNDKKILVRCLMSSLVLLTVTVVALYMENKLDLNTSLNVMVLYGFIAVAYLSADLSIKFSQRNFTLIEQQAIYNTNLEMKIDLDPMTKMYNHDAFFKKLEGAMELKRSVGQECCLAMIDIDDFKFVNDTYGHNAGDVVLCTLADILKSTCTDVDFPCRYGGEEFALIFCKKTLQEAENAVGFALKRFSETHFMFGEKNLTFSCGIANFTGEESWDSFFNRADEYLYESKRNGKNMITCYI